jgi:hypothetical protein
MSYRICLQHVFINSVSFSRWRLRLERHRQIPELSPYMSSHVHMHMGRKASQKCALEVADFGDPKEEFWVGAFY